MACKSTGAGVPGHGSDAACRPCGQRKSGCASRVGASARLRSGSRETMAGAAAHGAAPAGQDRSNKARCLHEGTPRRETAFFGGFLTTPPAPARRAKGCRQTGGEASRRGAARLRRTSPRKRPPAPGVARCAGRSSDSWTRAVALLLGFASRMLGSSAGEAVRFQLPLRGSSGFAPDSLFSPAALAGRLEHRRDNHNGNARRLPMRLRPAARAAWHPGRSAPPVRRSPPASAARCRTAVPTAPARGRA